MNHLASDGAALAGIARRISGGTDPALDDGRESVQRMQMLVIIFRNSWESEVLRVLRACNVGTFTDVTEVLGAGETGAALHTVTRPGFNSMILTALAEPDAERVADALRHLRDDAVAQQHGNPIPLRVFALPCTLVV